LKGIKEEVYIPEADEEEDIPMAEELEQDGKYDDESSDEDDQVVN